jgi:hypothetical protein
VVSTPIASAAISSSRMANSARPSVDTARRRAITTVARAETPTHTRFVRAGSPESPVACPRNFMFSMMERMISPKPSVTMAR